MLLNNIIIGVSGGPDSMYLLNEVNKKPKFIPIAVHINYNFREESYEEQKFVENFCNENGIKLFVFEVKESDWDKYKYLGNKQSMARQLRYDKYFEIAKQEKTKHIFIAHHKDDFIETAIMQERKSNDYLYFGIQQINVINGFIINRPLIDMWKEDIINSLNENGLDYKIDKTNFEPIYERNKIRLELKDLSKEHKEKIFIKFNEINDSKKDLREKVDSSYDSLIKSNLDWVIFNEIHNEIKRYVIYKLLINSETRINISSDKLDGIVEFLKNKRPEKSYRLMKNVFMSVKNSKIIIYNN